jgi:ABC-type Fe3+/spermidine/putrescine transport system ATPase subunit
MFEIRGLRRTWPDFSLDLGLSLADGEIAAVLGPSGSGKSTLLRLIAGLERPDAGQIVVDGREVSALGPERRGIGLVFQDFALFPQMSVRRNIEYGPRMLGLPKKERAETVRTIAQVFEISVLLDRSPRSLSGGEQQRVALARTLAANPALVLLDEPLSSLDASLRRRLRTEIGDSLRKTGKTALFVTHDAEEAFAIADRIFVMGKGRIIEEGSPEEIYERPETVFTARLLDEGPVIPCELSSKEGSPKEDGMLVAATTIGSFLCLPPRAGYALGERYSVFFPEEAAVLDTDISHAPRAAEMKERGRFRGRLVSYAYAGSCLRGVLDCAVSEGGNMTMEVELPLGMRLEKGECLSFRVSPGKAVLVKQ